jgi:predicted transcriptional regulator
MATNPMCGKVGRTVALTPELDADLQRLATKFNTSVSQLLRDLIVAALEKHQIKNSKPKATAL